ncbi:MAG: hypothetical protein H6909_04050 [Rickettsiaceae bacterium]|nr:hypothetical protein [Rickettsiaceae bacterium]
MKKIILNSAIIFVVTLITCISIILYTDFKSAYDQIASTVKVDPSSIKTDDIEIVKFPFPYIKIKHIKQDGKIELSEAKIKFSVWSILTLNPKINSIYVKEVILRLDSDDTNLIYHDHFIAELIQKDLLSIKTNIDKLTLVESDNDISMIMTNFLLKKSGDNYNFSAQTEQNRILNGNFHKNEDNIIFNLESSSDNYELSLQETYKDNKLVEGKASFKNLNLLDPILNLIPNFIAHSQEFSTSERINADFAFTSDENNWHISALTLSSNWLQGSGEVLIARPSHQSKINLLFDKIDLSNLSDNNQDQLTYAPNRFVAMKYDSSIYCLIKNLSFKSEQIHNVELKADIVDSITKIESLTGNFDENHKFQVNGNITSNSFLNAFDGVIEISHPNISQFRHILGNEIFTQSENLDFTFRSNVRITPVYFSFQNMNLNLAEMNIIGDYSTKFIGQLPRINANLKINLLDLDTKSPINIINDIKEWLENSLSGMKKDNYQNKFIPIRKLNSIGSYDIIISNLKYQQQEYNNISFNLETEPSSVAINRLYFNDKENWCDLSVSLSTKALNPLVIVKINDGIIHHSTSSAQDLLDLRTQILENLDLSKINFLFTGYLTSLKNGDSSFDRVIFSFNNNKNLLTFSDLNFDLFSGRLTTAGSILLEPLTINFSYALNSANLSNISNSLPANLLNLDGAASANGIISTHGDSLEKLLYNLYSKSSVIAKGVVLNNFSIDQFIETINNENYDVSNVLYDVDKMLLTDNTTIIDFKSDLLLSKGVIDMAPITFKTQLTSNNGNLRFNIYDYNLEANFSTNFYILHKRKFKPVSYQPLSIELKASGDIMNIDRKITTDKIVEVINMRNTEESVTNIAN